MNIKLKGLDPISLLNWNSQWSPIVGGCVVSQTQKQNYKKVQTHYCIIQTFGLTVLLNTLDVGSLMDMTYEVFMKSHIVMNLTFFGKINF